MVGLRGGCLGRDVENTSGNENTAIGRGGIQAASPKAHALKRRTRQTRAWEELPPVAPFVRVQFIVCQFSLNAKNINYLAKQRNTPNNVLQGLSLTSEMRG